MVPVPVWLISLQPKTDAVLLSINYAVLQDINAAGGAAFTADNSITSSNVSGWIVNSLLSKDLYWVGGTGDWNDSYHWALTSGGAGGSCIPSPIDNVFFDNNS